MLECWVLIMWQKTSLCLIIFFGNLELELSVLMLSCTVKGRASLPTLPQCQPRDCQVHLSLYAWLGVLEIGLKLHSVHFAVKFSSALTAPRLQRTWLQSAPRAYSTQVRLTPILDLSQSRWSRPSSTFRLAKCHFCYTIKSLGKQFWSQKVCYFLAFINLRHRSPILA